MGSVNLPGLGQRVRLHRKRIKSGYTGVRVTNSTRALLAKIEAQYDEPLDSIIFYLAAKELGLNDVAILSVLDHELRRLGCARAAR